MGRRQHMANDIKQRALDDIKQYGWHLIIVPDDEGGPGFVYSVGMMQTLKHPEIIMFGLESDLMVEVIHGMGIEIEKGRRFAAPGLADDLLKECACKIIAGDKRWHEEYMGYAVWHRQHVGQAGTLQAVQCVWPDKQGRFPDDPSCNRDVIAVQPILGSV